MSIFADVKFKKSLGQNFVKDSGFLASVVAKTNAAGNDVLEIGAGIGTLTREIAKVAKKVVAYEIDKSLEPMLKNNLSEFKNIEIRFEDALQARIPFEQDFVLVANLPYYITTPLIFKFLENPNCTQINVMVQKEVGERIIAKSGTKDYGALTVSVGAVANTKIIAQAPRALFTPQPNVDSVVIGITKKALVPLNDNFKKLVRCAFENRRKILSSNISHSFKITKQQATDMLESLGLDPLIRGERLSVEQFIELSNML